MNKFRNACLPPCLPNLTIRFRVFFILISLFPFRELRSQTMLEKVDLTQRITQSNLIVEGRVISQEAFWKKDSSGIMTRHKIETFKSWKGDTRHPFVYVITPGGQIGNQMEVVAPSLELELYAIGTFFLKAYGPLEVPSDLESIPAYTAFASLQGFIRYDELTGKASDVYTLYRNLDKEVYQRIESLTRSSALQLKSYQLSRPKLSARATPAINSFSPQEISAGTEAELTIQGSNFGTQGSSSTVYFAKSDNGGASYISAPSSHIVSWSDTEIVVRVPSGAGSGKIQIKNDGGQLGESGQSITISYAQINISAGGTIYRPFLANRNGTGGYTLQYSTNTDNNGVDFTSIGKAPFERALDSWHCATGVQFDVGSTSNSTEVNASNPPNLILFTNDVNTLPSGVLGRTNSWFISCDGVNWLLDGFDIIFRKSGTGGITWNFSEDDPCSGCYDFESVSLHELGHAHLLGHVINSSHVMHYSISNGRNKRELEASSAIMGARGILAEKKGHNLCFSFYPGMAPEYPNCGVSIATLRTKVYLEGYYQSETGTMNTFLLDKGLLPSAASVALSAFSYTGQERINSFPAQTTDWMLLELFQANDTALIAQKAVLLKDDGTVVDITGNEYLSFDGVEAGDYLLGIHHPGHLSAISTTSISLGETGELYDFTLQQNAQLKQSDGVYYMYAGDYSQDGRINDEDFQIWRVHPSSMHNYSPSDGNGDGQISVQDVNLWMINRNRQTLPFFMNR